MRSTDSGYKYVIVQKDARTGKPRYYFWADRKQRVRMPEPLGSEAFVEAYNKLLADTQWIDSRQTFENNKKRELGLTVDRKIRSSRARARKSKLPFELDYDWAIQKIEANNFRCELTGLSFMSDADGFNRVNPYAPSFDRIDPSLGYTKENVRIVIFAINVMLLDWGTELFEKIIRSYEREKRTNRVSKLPQGQEAITAKN